MDVPITASDGLFAGKVYALTLRLWNREIAETDQDWLLYAPRGGGTRLGGRLVCKPPRASRTFRIGVQNTLAS